MAIDGITSLSDGESVQNLRNYAQNLLNQNLYTQARPNYNGNSFLSYKNYIQTVANKIGSAQGLSFIATQGALKLMNQGDVGSGKLVDPSFVFGPPPFFGGVKTDLLDVPISSLNPRSDAAIRNDGLNIQKIKAKANEINKINLYSEESKFDDFVYVDSDQPENVGVNGTKVKELLPGVEYAVPDYAAIFERKISGPDFGDGQKGAIYFEKKTSSRQRKDDTYKLRTTAIDDFDAIFHKSDAEKGYINWDEDEIGQNLSEVGNYMPFFFTDSRAPNRRIYFRAFFKGLRESISPEWSTERYFGRVDPVGIYKGTTRTVAVNFSVVATSPAGFTAMWRKLNNLTKLLYPTYREGVMVKSPVGRMRIGDVLTDAAGSGLPGYISSPLELDYTESPWEISEWVGYDAVRELGKAPMMAICSFTFTVIHDRNPALDINNNFDTSTFRRIGGLPDSVLASQEDIDGGLVDGETFPLDDSGTSGTGEEG